jgi:hypothetical protein
MISAIEVDADGRLTRVRFWDKNAALEKAMKHLGLYNRDNTPAVGELEPAGGAGGGADE